MRDDRQLVTYTEMQDFLHCRRKAELRYELCLVPKKSRDGALFLGNLVHEALRIWHRHRSLDLALDYINRQLPAHNQHEDQLRDWQMATAMLTGYAKRYKIEPFKIVWLERQFRTDITNPDNRSEVSKRFVFGGKVDGLVEIRGRFFLIEHKTAAIVGSAYLDRLWTDFQITAYCHAIERAYGNPISGVVYNVIQKTKIRPRVNESRDEFLERLIAVYDDPQMFTRQDLIISKDQYVAVERLIWELAQERERCQKRGFYYQNPGACFMYNRPCRYYPICSSGGSELVVDEHFEKREPHEELREDDERPF